MAHSEQYHDESPSSQRPPVSPLLQSQRASLHLQTTGRNGHELNDHDTVSPIMSHTPSIASDSRFSALSAVTVTFPATPANVQPPAAYVAPFGAAQVVSDHQSALASEHGNETNVKPSKDDVSFSPSSLALINSFLDQLLYSFLSSARATTLGALRTAVTDILRHKLARDAIASANEELSDLLAGGDDEDEQDNGQGESKLDVDLIWRRTRLRVMVYMRLGEMEDDDEERYVKEQDMLNGERGRFSSTAGLVSWSAAIFLTSVLEHVAEQTLQAAGSAAFNRVRGQGVNNVHVEDQDAERIAATPSLGRLWRSWRKTVRTTVRPTTPINTIDDIVATSPAKSVSTFRDSFGTAPESVQGDFEDDEDDEDGERVVERPENDVPEPQYPEYILASNIRLPMGDPDRDIEEIEVPGLAADPSEHGSDGARTPTVTSLERRRSFSNYQSRSTDTKDLVENEHDEEARERPTLNKRRSTSVPAPMRNLLAVLIGKDEEPVEKVEEKPVAQKTAAPRQKTIGDLLLDEAPDAPRTAEAQESYDLTIEELDKRKSLIDIKTLLAAINGGHAAFRALEERPSTQESVQTLSLADKEKEPSQQPDDVQADTAPIGVATTADRAIVPERTASTAGNKSTSPAPRKVPEELSRAPSVARSRHSPEQVDEVKQGAESPPVEISARDRPIDPNEQTLALLRQSVQRASSPQTTQQNPETMPALNRRSIISQYASPVSAFSSQAQQLDQTMVKEQAITSASIKGPEDFNQFNPSDDVDEFTLAPEQPRDAPTTNADSLAQLTGEVPEVVKPTVTTNAQAGRLQNGKPGTPATPNAMSEAEKKRHRFSVTRPPTRNSSVSRRSGMMAREARVVTESTRDFADFIRSTRPDKEPTVAPIMSAQAYRNSTNYSLPRSMSLTGGRIQSMTGIDYPHGQVPPVPIGHMSKIRAQMEPRTANGASEESGELIAFIRDGPRVGGEPRISRTVAPFRNTMDSDQFDALGATPRTTKSANNDSSQASKRGSMFINGSTNAASIAHPAYSSQQQIFNPLSSNPANADPTRRHYLNKDPYAIDLDDDEDISALPRSRHSVALSTTSDKPIASAASLAQARELMERARAKSIQATAVELTSLPPTPSKAGERLGYSETSNTNELADFLRNSEPPASAPSVARAAPSEKSVPATEKKKRSRGFSFFFRKGSSKSTAARHADMP